MYNKLSLGFAFCRAIRAYISPTTVQTIADAIISFYNRETRHVKTDPEVFALLNTLSGKKKKTKTEFMPLNTLHD